MGCLLFKQAGVLRLRRGITRVELSNLVGMVFAGLALGYLSVRGGLAVFPLAQFSFWGIITSLGVANKRILQSGEPALLLTQPVSLLEVTIGLSLVGLVDAILLWLPFAFGFSIYLMFNSVSIWRVFGDMLMSMFVLTLSMYASTLVMLSIRPSIHHLTMPWVYWYSRLLDRAGHFDPYLGQELGFTLRKPVWLMIWLGGSAAVWTAVLIKADSYTLSVATSLAPMGLGLWGVSAMTRFEETALMRVVGASIAKEIWVKQLLLLSANTILVTVAWAAKASQTGLSALDIWGVLITAVATGVLTSALGLWIGALFWSSLNHVTARQASAVLAAVLYGAIELPAIIVTVPLIRGEPLPIPPALLTGLILVFVLGAATGLLADAARRMERVSIHGPRP